MPLMVNSFHLDTAPSAVFEHLTTPANYVGLSPLVVEVRDVDTSAAGMIRYTAVERFPLGITNPIDVELFVEGLSVFGQVRSPGNVRLAYRFDLRASGSGTQVEDRLELTAPWYLVRFASGQARKVQLARARILEERLSVH
ncbi:SRPBCC family protein [Nonomuraea sp. NPDC050556]|uniref:SRPBCC family protein n=1 Tax=Nonomuraea sp. NPDC050556 TaxID=3364369 RepID=UPI00379089F1